MSALVIDPAVIERVDRTALDPVLAFLPRQMDTPNARRLLIAAGLQESRLHYRRQILDGGGFGAAASLWQIEQPTVRLILINPASRYWAHALCEWQRVAMTSAAVWEAIASNDVLGAGMARLLMFCDPWPLPTGEDKAWEWYAYRVWRPGKPHRHTWGPCWKAASDFYGMTP